MPFQNDDLIDLHLQAITLITLPARDPFRAGVGPAMEAQKSDTAMGYLRYSISRRKPSEEIPVERREDENQQNCEYCWDAFVSGIAEPGSSNRSDWWRVVAGQWRTRTRLSVHGFLPGRPAIRMGFGQHRTNLGTVPLCPERWRPFNQLTERYYSAGQPLRAGLR